MPEEEKKPKFGSSMTKVWKIIAVILVIIILVVVLLVMPIKIDPVVLFFVLFLIAIIVIIFLMRKKKKKEYDLYRAAKALVELSHEDSSLTPLAFGFNKVHGIEFLTDRLIIEFTDQPNTAQTFIVERKMPKDGGITIVGMFPKHWADIWRELRGDQIIQNTANASLRDLKIKEAAKQVGLTIEEVS